MFDFEGDLRLTAQGLHFGNPQQIKLLKEIHSIGSITQAAKAVPMSYKSAWDVVNIMNNLSKEPLVIRVAGGKGGGGTQLTERGLQLIKHFDLIQEAHSAFLKSMNQYSQDLAENIDLLQQLRFQTSARNQLSGKVIKINSIGIHDHIYFEIGAEHLLKAIITAESIKLLKVAVGEQFILLIKAPNIESMALDDKVVENSFIGTIISKQVEKEASEIICKIGNQTAVSTAVHKDAQKLNEGDEIKIVMDPSSIILVKI